jgi:hypothetical protein
MQLEYGLGVEPLPTHVYLDGTYKVYALTSVKDGLTADLKVYGTQTIRIRCAEPRKVSSDSDSLIVAHFSYGSSMKEAFVRVRAADMLGSRGRTIFQY